MSLRKRLRLPDAVDVVGICYAAWLASLLRSRSVTASERDSAFTLLQVVGQC